MAAPDYARCVSWLTAKKIVFEQAGDVTRQGCRLSGAVSLSVVPTLFGDVSLSAKPTLLCSFAQRFGEWMQDAAAPLTFAYTGQKLARIDTGPGFACTARYDKPGALPSEHAKGDAIDVVAFGLADNRRIAVKEDGLDNGPMRALLHALRTAACGYFTTVLGPGADPYHATHLHLDTGLHGSTPNYRICE